MSNFERPDTRTLHLSNGDTLVVKKHLNAGERRRMFASMYSETAGGALRVNPARTGISKVLAFLLDWSFVDDDGKSVPIRDRAPEDVEAALDALKTDVYQELQALIEAHEAAMQVEREKEKNAPAGGPGSKATSPSP